tara:strand:- start:34246 stop:36000 length:1755 start_codon:yes stop_codon:yes gene_type:complete
MQRTKIITTNLESKLQTNQKYIFAGDWCKLESSEKDENIFQNIWNDRSQMFDDYKYLCILHQKLLVNLKNYLNKIHNKNFEKRYWQILLDPWLFSYIGSTYFRWKTIEKILSTKEPFETKIYSKILEHNIIFDYDEYRLNIASSQVFNHIEFAKILTFFEKKNYDLRIKFSDSYNLEFDLKKKIYKKNIKDITTSLIDQILFKYTRKNSVFIDDTLFHKSIFIKLHGLIKQLPLFGTEIFGSHKVNKENLYEEKYLSKSRNNDLFVSYDNLFEEYISSVIKFDLPTSLIEYYGDLYTRAENIKVKPKLIISSRKHWTNLIFKFWLARSFNTGTRIMCVCHGGGYGLKMEAMNFENDISDVKANWYKPYHPKHIQCPAINLTKIRRNINSKYLMVVGFENPIFPRRIESTPISGQTLYLLDHINKFYVNLSHQIQGKFLIRPYSDQGWNFTNKFRKTYGNKKLILGNNYYQYLKKSKIVVCTYPETSFCESMLSGPTILLYNDKYWEVIDEFKELHESLINSKIIFNNPLLAAQHINEVFADVDVWWKSNKVINSRNLFSNYVSNKTENPLQMWKQIINLEKNKS